MSEALRQYLNEEFYSLEELLVKANCCMSEFSALQDARMVPRASYVLVLDSTCTSYFGEHAEVYRLEYYAKKYSCWVNLAANQENEKEAFESFRKRYLRCLDGLRVFGFADKADQQELRSKENLEGEWAHFLEGTYGLCTRSGLPEDIAAKELAIRVIKKMTVLDSLTAEQSKRISQAVNLLDSVCSEFAPHEREQSSRRRYVNEVRKKYSLVG